MALQHFVLRLGTAGGCSYPKPFFGLVGGAPGWQWITAKLLNDKLSDLRRDLYRETKENLHKEVLKGTRWLLLKNPENLDTQKKEKERLEEALKLNEPLSCAYYLKEDLRQIWLQPNKETAERVFTD